MLKGSAKTKFNLTTKWDGAPAVFVGTDPADGKFFVGTKSVFNKRELVNKSIQDIKANHEAEGLQEKLISAFTHLQKLNFNNKVVQGDLLYTDDSIQEANIQRRRIHCVPNQTQLYMLYLKTVIHCKRYFTFQNRHSVPHGVCRWRRTSRLLLQSLALMQVV